MKEAVDAIADLNRSALCVTDGDTVGAVADIAVADSGKVPVAIAATGFGYDADTEALHITAIDGATR